MNIEDVVTPARILEDAFAHPSLRIKVRSTKRPDIDLALKTVLKTVEMSFASAMADRIRAEMQPEYDMYVLVNGEFEDAEDQGAWEAGIDDVVERVCEAHQKYLSADWLGRNTIGTSLHMPGGMDKFCASFGLEFFKELTHGKSPNKIMSNAGIPTAMVEKALAAHLKKAETEKETMSKNDDDALSAVISKIAEHVGADYDVMTVYEDLDLVSDEEDVLAHGAAPRLGLNLDDVATLQGERLIHGSGTADVLAEMLKAKFNPVEEEKGTKSKGKGKAKVEAKPAPVEKPKTSARKPAKVEPEPEPEIDDESADAEGNIDPIVLAALKECGAQDTKMAEAIGVSRATYNGYANGKAAFIPNAEQWDVLRGEVVFRINKLLEALGTMDGEDYEAVE